MVRSIAVIVCYLLLGRAVGTAEPLAKMCSGVEVRSVVISRTFGPVALDNDVRPSIEVRKEPTPSVQDATRKVVMVIAIGPVLGSMDAPDVKVKLACTTTGFLLTAGVTRSSGYVGATAKNILWRPRIEISAITLKSQASARVKWKMRSSSGRDINRARTLPYPEQEYPIDLTAILP